MRRLDTGVKEDGRTRAEERLEETRELERSRIARALHDVALQELADALILAMSVRSASSELGPASQLVPALRRVHEQLRSAIYDLRLGASDEGRS